MIEVLPFELAFRHRVEQQLAHVTAIARGHGDEAVQAPRHFRIAVPVDAHQAGAQQRLVGAESRLDGVGSLAEHHRQGGPSEVQDTRESAAAEDVGDHPFDDRLRLMAQQQFEDVDVGWRQADGLPQAPQALRPAVGPYALQGRVLAAQRVLDAAPPPGRQPLVVIKLPFPASPPAAREHLAILPARQPVSQFRGLGIPVMEPGGNIGQVEGSEALFVDVQHGVLPVDRRIRLVQGGKDKPREECQSIKVTLYTSLI